MNSPDRAVTVSPRPAASAPAHAGDPYVQIAGVPDFWDRVRQAGHRLLAIDYDGTLAPFRITRERAVPVEGACETLKRIRDLPGQTVAVLSGRPAFQIVELMGKDIGIPIFGAHGWELVRPDGTTSSFRPSELQEQGLTKAIALTIDAGYAEYLEKKSASIAIHTRALANPDEVERRFKELYRPVAEQHKLTVMHFNRGVELRSLGRHKGVALADIYLQLPPDTLPVYIGDDTTDEDAFRYVRSRGIGIKVGAGNVPTAATGHVPDEAGVLAVLKDWLRATGS